MRPETEPLDLLRTSAAPVGLVSEAAGHSRTEVARLLGVSEGTVRNDLRALAQSKQITRVRGGAVVGPHNLQSPAFSARARTQAVAKRRIARWVAELIEDGDTLPSTPAPRSITSSTFSAIGATSRSLRMASR